MIDVCSVVHLLDAGQLLVELLDLIVETTWLDVPLPIVLRLEPPHVFLILDQAGSLLVDLL